LQAKGGISANRLASMWSLERSEGFWWANHLLLSVCESNEVKSCDFTSLTLGVQCIVFFLFYVI